MWNFKLKKYLLFKIGIVIMTFLIINVDNTSANVQTYIDVCDDVIMIGTEDQAARLKYYYKPRSSQLVCNITIETLERYQTHGGYYHIAYTFLDTGIENNFKCTTHIFYNNGFSSNRLCGSNVYPDVVEITRDNVLYLTVTGDGNTDFEFDMLFLSFHNGSCATYETRCQGLLGDSNTGSACVDYSLVCHETYTFCGQSNSQCSDIISPTGSNNTVIAVTLVTLVAVLFTGLICFLCYKKNFCSFLKRDESEDVRTTARNIFSVQLATRGVDGNDNAAATDDEGNPIDFSQFDPPPEYGSLEHLDNAGVIKTDGNANPDEVLPSYSDVMRNFDNYTVTTQI
ncbi:uncharacterized protein LOC123530592 [Mercenaria mercenaria]|uniref:uncharacterized protein LOC123530592 n=1 Tax=Mercenaria mercenaria TaxID=6596 RepID=UPI00234F0FCB|nr:uncharacterized protein LOC123530592 [Mercenaria mercenaria]